VNTWKTEGLSNREIVRRLGVSEMAIRKVVRRLGWKPPQRQKMLFGKEFDDANPNLSGSAPASALGAGDASAPGVV
jgi:transposase